MPLANCRPDGGLATDAGLAGCVAAGASAPAELVVSSLAAGNWLLVVDGTANTSGPFALSLALAPVAAPPANDVCTAAIDLTFTPQSWGMLATTTGTTVGAVGDHNSLDGGCPTTGADVAFTFTTPADGGLDGGSVNLKAAVWSNNLVESNPSLFLERACDGGLIACRGPLPGPAVLNAWQRPSSTPYVLWVDQGGAETGSFTLEVEIATGPPPNESCAAPAALALDSTVGGSTLGASNDYSGSTVATDFYLGGQCTSFAAGAEVVYAFTTTVRGSYTVRISPERTFNPTLVVTRACSAGNGLSSADFGLAGEEETVTFDAPPQTTYFVFVDSFADDPVDGTSRGRFGVSVSSPATPGTVYPVSCAAVLSAGQSTGNGVYSIDPQQYGVAEQAFCDMTTLDGGWTVLVNNDGLDAEPSGCIPRIATDPAMRCGTPVATADYALYAAGLAFTELIFSTQDAGFASTSGAYQAMQWSAPQTLPFGATWTLARPSSIGAAVPGWVGAPIACTGAWAGIPANVRARAGVFAPGFNTVTVFGEPSDAGTCPSIKARLSFTDAIAASPTSSLAGLDDFSDGCGCGDQWTPGAFRGAAAYLMVR